MTRTALSLTAIVLGILGLLSSAGAQSQGMAYSMELTGTIDPATEAWVGKALDEAEDEDAELVIIRLDTPGGLDTSMREIMQDIIAAPMPVVVYVSPDGARAASAGLFVTQAADVAAMAPADQHRLGLAHLDRRRGRRARSSGARSRTTPSPTSARSPRSTAATATSPRRWSPTPRT